MRTERNYPGCLLQGFRQLHSELSLDPESGLYDGLMNFVSPLRSMQDLAQVPQSLSIQIRTF